ncbi:exosortase A [Agaribacter flavus]|uniref:Exosortase A n=1 Tax=Agaribacter flavus TaxID=1902781 RepID=A0ABV7FM50_9ALTE
MLQQGNSSKPMFLLMAVVFALWLAFTWTGVVTAVKIWYVSEIFNHCFIVLPACVYLIWEKRKQVPWQNAHIQAWLIPIIFSQILLYLFGYAGDINLFMHLAAFSLLISLPWFMLGNQIAKSIMFPLFFVIFCIPIGEELVPLLQEIAADFSVILLKGSGVPVFKSGLYIEIPEGKFLVAEACSGISFLIASIVLGNLYAYLNLKRWKTRLFFVGLSIAFPIFANVIRVYGIIMIGHLTDMEHAVGADHLIYGWFFFAFVLIVLFVIGEIIRKYEKPISSKFEEAPSTLYETKPYLRSTNSKVSLGIMLCGLIAGLGKIYALNQDIVAPQFTPVFETQDQQRKVQSVISWQPSFDKAVSIQNNAFEIGNARFVEYVALFSTAQGEIVRNQDRLYAQDRWTIESKASLYVDENTPLSSERVVSVTNQNMVIYSAYLIHDKLFTNKTKAKIYETWKKLSQGEARGAMIAIAVMDDSSSVSQAQITERFTKLRQRVQLQTKL